MHTSLLCNCKVHISTEEEQTAEGERIVTLTGTAESVLLAQFLVQSNIDLYQKEHQVNCSLFLSMLLC